MPLLLGGCGLPIGIQIASLFADGVSFLATDKTLSDHGISLVAEKDCALWRVFKGEDVCRSIAPDDVLVADASEEPEIAAFPDGADAIVVADIAAFPDGADSGESPEAVPAPDGPVVLVAEAEVGERPEVEVEELASVFEPKPRPETRPIVTVAELPPSKPVIAWARPAVVIAELPPSKPEYAGLAAFETAAGAEGAADGTPAAEMVAEAVEPGVSGTFLIIASYFRAEDAERFVRSRDELDAKVLSGTAKGREVYRVAVGPVARSERARAMDDLLRAGFRDVWALSLREPKVVVQMAAID